MSIQVTLADWHAAESDARLIRSIVFIQEQNVPVALEWDDMDAVSRHAIARDAQGAPIGTGRLLPDGHIGRMAVMRTHRRQGVGATILDSLVQEAIRRGDRSVQLHAQRHAEGFYRRHGFMPDGEPFLEAGIEHIVMRRDLAD